MTDDKELIARPMDEEFDTMMEVQRNPHGAWQAIQTLTEQLAAARQDAKAAEDELEMQEQEACMMENDYIKLEKERDALEAKLARAVELALEECPFRAGTPKYDKWWHHRRATLAEIKGESQ